MFPTDILTHPGHGFWFGTDQFGRDVLSRILLGLRLSLEVAFLSAGLGALVGTAIGVIAGYYGGAIDALLMRLMDIMMAFPALLLAIAIMTVLGTATANVVLAIGLVYTPVFARVARGPALALRGEEMVTAARAMGAPDRRILWRHILPNMLSPTVVQVSLAISDAVLIEAALSYLGLGVRPPAPSLGSLIQEGQAMMQMAPWLTIFPGIAIAVMVLSFNLLGDAVRDLLDPQLRKLG